MLVLFFWFIRFVLIQLNERSARLISIVLIKHEEFFTWMNESTIKKLISEMLLLRKYLALNIIIYN